MKSKAIFILKVISAVAAAILGVLGAASMTSCGVTKATISKPAEGTQTTITITTNNPITTNVDPTTDVNFKGKEQKQ